MRPLPKLQVVSRTSPLVQEASPGKAFGTRLARLARIDRKGLARVRFYGFAHAKVPDTRLKPLSEVRISNLPAVLTTYVLVNFQNYLFVTQAIYALTNKAPTVLPLAIAVQLAWYTHVIFTLHALRHNDSHWYPDIP